VQRAGRRGSVDTHVCWQSVCAGADGSFRAVAHQGVQSHTSNGTGRGIYVKQTQPWEGRRGF
jgi:hypothetical protein